MTFNYYGLDERARRLIKNQIEKGIQARLDAKEINILIKESHKMRQTVIYGLERFWGEKLRLESNKPLESAKAQFWAESWDELVSILKIAAIELPSNDNIDEMTNQLWNLSPENQQVALAVLTQFCDSLVWWTQRYKYVVGGL